jgi:hypothetical protein
MTTIYDNGKIYKLVCDDEHYYIGSTILKLNLRFNSHKATSKREDATSRVYKHINEIGWDKVKIELIEIYPCDSKKELTEREDHYIQIAKDDHLCLNFNRAHVSPEEKLETMKKYYEENKEKIIAQHKEYIEENKEKVDAYHAEYRKGHAEERREYSKKYAEEHPEWVKTSRKAKYEKNKAKELEQSKKYKEEHKEKIAEQKLAWQRKKRAEYLETHAEEIAKKKEEKQKKKEERIAKEREIVKCECGGSYQQYQKKRHMESKKHKSFVSA